MSFVTEDELLMDVEDGWSYSMPPSLESLPLPLNKDASEEDALEQESIISELETSPMKRDRSNLNLKLRIDTGVPLAPIDIVQTGKKDDKVIRSPPKPTTLGSSVGGSTYSGNGGSLAQQLMKSSPANPLTTVDPVHKRNSSHSELSFYNDDNASSEDRRSNGDNKPATLTDALYQLKQTMSGSSIASESTTNNKPDTVLSSSVSVSTPTQPQSQLPTSESNHSFFSSFRNLAQSMLTSPSGSSTHQRTVSETGLMTPVALAHRRTVSTASSTVPPVSEEGEFHVTSNGKHLEHHPEIISYRRGRRDKSASVSSVNGSSFGNGTLKSPSSISTEISSPLTPSSGSGPSFDRHLYIDEFFQDTEYRYATLKRNADFHNLFVSIPMDDRFLDDFSCALSREILIQGRLYISEHHLAFNSNILGWVTNLVVPFADIVSIEKTLTAGFFNNGIAIETKDAKHYFATFISRNATFKFLNTVWEKLELLSTETSSIFKDRKWKLKYKTDGIGINLDLEDGIAMEEDDSDRSGIGSGGHGADFDMMMSIDGDTPRIRSTSSGEFEPGTGLQLKPDSGYLIEGPLTHSPTKIDYDPKEHDENLLFLENIAAPPGLVLNILFGENIKFHRHLMEMSDGSNFSEYSKFQDHPLTRSFTYSKALGYSIGPKSTKVNVVETIEKRDFDSHINVLTTSTTPDVPSGNVFTVNTRYILLWGPNNSTNFQLSYYIKWTGKSWIKGVIESQTASGQKDAAALLLKELKLELDRVIDTTATVAMQPLLAEKSENPHEQTPEEPVANVNTSPVALHSEARAPGDGLPRWLILVLVALVASQLYTIGLVRENNSLAKQQIELSHMVLRNQMMMGSKRTIKSKINDIFGSTADEEAQELDLERELEKKIKDDLEYYNNEI